MMRRMRKRAKMSKRTIMKKKMRNRREWKSHGENVNVGAKGVRKGNSKG